jgi:hypothetical protein
MKSTMKKNRPLFIILPMLCSLLLALLYSQVDMAWVRRYNGPGNMDDWACSIAVDGQDNIFVTGYSWLNNNADYATIKYVQTEGIEEYRQPLSADRFSLGVYPNPASSVIRVRVPESESSSG